MRCLSLCRTAICVILAFTQSSLLAQDFSLASPESLEDAAARAVSVRLVSERTALSPGETGTIGLTFDIAPGWHLYWRNAGDSGLPIFWEIAAPQGAEVGVAAWPAPTRHLAPGEILDYIYEDRVTILLPLTVSESAETGDIIRVKAKVNWLVCREGCVPGEATTEVAIPVGGEGIAGVNADVIAQARDRIPQPQSAFEASGGKVAWEGDVLTIVSPGASRMEFFPYENTPQPFDLVRQGEVKGDAIRLRYDERIEPAAGVLGVAAVNHASGRRYYLIDVPPPPQ